MKIYRIKVSAWTSSFRYPNVISGYQPTLLVPPISTVLGLINACAGFYLKYDSLDIGYYFDYEAKAVDLETIYQIELNTKGIPKNQTKSNVLHREFLFNCRLFVYLADARIAEYFKHPFFQILLGRSNDLATIEEIRECDLAEVDHADKIKGQVIPFADNYLPGTVQALPKYFTDTLPRQNIGTEPYSVIPYDIPDFPTSLKAYSDFIDGREIDILMHHLELENKY
jgi:CRISPR-associated protein Cas5t